MNSIFSAVSSLQNLPNLFSNWAKQSLINCLMTEVKNCRIQPKKNIYKPLFHQIFKTSKQREHAIQRVLRKYYKLKTYSKPLHLILTSNFPYILNINQSTASGVETVQMKGRAKSLLVIRRKSRRKKVWFVAYVRNPTQCSRVNLGS